MRIARVGVGALPPDRGRASRVNQAPAEYQYFATGPGVADPDISDTRDQHAAEVLAASERLGTDDPERISEHLYLHVSIVRRHLGLGPPPRAARPPRLARVIAYLREHGPSTAKEIAAGIGAGGGARSDGSLGQLLVASPHTFRKAGMKPTTGAPAYIWALAEGV